MTVIKLRAWLLVTALFYTIGLQAVEPSRTLPILYIDTDNHKEITSKEDYLPATYYIDNCGITGYESIGSAEVPLALQIRGRGNYTWSGFEKKPYRLKLDAKAPLLGMKASKHFVLLAHADDDLGFMRDEVGFELSRRMGLPWTPSHKPVEVVLNGDYIGLYFLTENIRVDSDRVNVFEQADLETAPDAITGGWLVEIDNYDSDPHVRITEGNGERIIFTYKTPEVLSPEQEEWLTREMTAIDAAIYAEDKSVCGWKELVDLDALVRFYLVQEMMDDCESFHGSCYLWRERGEATKWNFGPVWDFGNSFRRSTKKFIYDEPQFNQTWIGEMAKFDDFQERVAELWLDFATHQYPTLKEYILSLADEIAEAARHDAERWPQYANSNIEKDAQKLIANLSRSFVFLSKQWGGPQIETSYTVYFDNSVYNWEQLYVYVWESGISGSELKRWPGVEVTEQIIIDDVVYYCYTFDPQREMLHPMIIFNNGDSGVPENQTEDLVLVNNGYYDANGLTAALSIERDNRGLQICGRNITAQGVISLYNMQGSLIARADSHLTAPAQGCYIVVTTSGSRKVIIR